MTKPATTAASGSPAGTVVADAVVATAPIDSDAAAVSSSPRRSDDLLGE